MTKLTSDFMSTDIVSLKESDSVILLLEVLGHSRISGLPVSDEAGRFVGFVSRSDLSHYKLLNCLRNDESLSTLSISDIMLRHSLNTIPDTAALRDAAKMMVSHHIHRLLVVNRQGEPKGILTTMDITRAYAEETLNDMNPLSDLDSHHHNNPITLGEVDDELMTLKDYEVQMLRLVAQEKTVTELAGIFLLDNDDIRTQLETILKKLDVATPKQAVAKAIEMGLFNLPPSSKPLSPTS